jgi:tol-pal system protein YbgF
VLYDRASQAFQQGQYDQARKEFQTFLNKYPKHEFADNALYSVGECHLAEKKYQEAVETFQQVLDRYPNGNKVPHALLKQGTAFQQMGDNTAARILYQRLASKYPGSPQAQIAEKKLKQMQ